MQARLDRARALINLDRHSEAVKDLARDGGEVRSD